MKRTFILTIAVLLLLPAALTFAGGSEEVVEDVMVSGFEGLAAVDRSGD